jgi:hypothetical protein
MQAVIVLKVNRQQHCRRVRSSAYLSLAGDYRVARRATGKWTARGYLGMLRLQLGEGAPLSWPEDLWQSCEAWITSQLGQTWISGIGVPMVLIVVGAAWKAMARPGGPTPYSILLRWPKLPNSDRAFGFDLLFAGLGVQLGFLALRIGQGYTARQLDFRGFWVTLVLTVLLIPFIRVFGYERKGRKQELRQDLGVALPNLAGMVVLIYTYNAYT